MTKTIVFISVAIHFVKYQYLIEKKLESKGIKVNYVTYSKEVVNFLKKRKVNSSTFNSLIRREIKAGNI